MCATVARLSVHAVTFAGWLAIAQPESIAPRALWLLYLAGAAFLALAPRSPWYVHRRATWALVAAYAVLLAAIFAGADFGLNALGNSAKPRQPLPALLGGVELYELLILGVAATSAGAWAGTWCRDGRLRACDRYR